MDTSSPESFQVLPEGCIAIILSFTTPRDACRLSLVSKIFRSAAESDAVWDKFVPSDYQSIISRSSSSLLATSSKKDLYFSLCDNPIIIDDGKKSFQLDRWSGKKCFMLAARDLYIVWGENPIYWSWTSLPESRFAEVAELNDVCWLEIRGKINNSMLSSATRYAAYLVFKMIDATGFDHHPAEASVGILGVSSTKSVCLDPDIEARAGEHDRIIPWQNFLELEHPDIEAGEHYQIIPQQNFLELERPRERSDGWLEIELGEFFSLGQEDEEVNASGTEINGGNWKSGLTVQGIEIRPKEDN
ncbi:F-box protein PP2 [Quillaja saponaria]|uniref:F-box protein PP2 n=1 Tax=Quillaja saponaria TaxID=32244 RepID=A0AAD7QB16_QUISA|nr:F-box protein PP2 [Quillaja saponaria]